MFWKNWWTAGSNRSKAANLPNDPNYDVEHLRLLSIFHYVVAGLTAFVSFFPLLYTGMGALFVYLARQPIKPGESPPPELLGWFLVGFGIFLAIVGFALAVLIFLTGRALARRRRYWFAFVVACLECIFIPFGTILGVFTLIVLSRESTKRLFAPETSVGPPQA
jgi:hypothetical protein